MELERGLLTAAYFAGVTIASIVRGKHTLPHRRAGAAADYQSKLDSALMALPALGMFILPIVYAASGWLSFADYALPLWAGVSGIALFIVADWMLWRSHVDLGRNWTPTLKIRDEHSLVTSGVYARVRHPMYAAHWLWALAQPLLLQNWIVGLATIVGFLPLYLTRVPREERMMIEQFGDEYLAYMNRTGRLLPRLPASQVDGHEEDGGE